MRVSKKLRAVPRIAKQAVKESLTLWRGPIAYSHFRHFFVECLRARSIPCALGNMPLCKAPAAFIFSDVCSSAADGGHDLPLVIAAPCSILLQFSDTLDFSAYFDVL